MDLSFYFILAFLALIIVITIFYYLSTLIFLISTRVPPVSSPKFIRKKIAQILELKNGQIFYDLGAGYGKLIVQVAKKYPACQVFGFEISPFCFLMAKIRILFSRTNAKIRFKNFYKADFSKADAFFCYLWPSIMIKIEEKFTQQAKPGAKLYIYAFPLPNLKPSQLFQFKEKNKTIKIYQYLKNH